MARETGTPTALPKGSKAAFTRRARSAASASLETKSTTPSRIETCRSTHEKMGRDMEGSARFYGSSSKPPSLNDGGADLFKRVTFDQVLKSVESSRER